MIADAVERSEKRQGRRENGKGLHFIEAGEVLVCSKTHIPNLRLRKNDTFGMCDLLKKIVSQIKCLIAAAC